MTLVNTSTVIALCLSGAHAVPVASSSSVDKEEFCRNLTELESHMTGDLMALNNTFRSHASTCACSELDMNDYSFTISCSMEGTHCDGDADAFVHSEQMVFELNQDVYELSETSWSYEDSEVTLYSQEVFHLENGFITSCKANECRSCQVCDDNKSIRVDCGNLEESFDYTIECSEGYTGSFSHTFDFGVIAVEEFIRESCRGSNTTNSITQDILYNSLTNPESHNTTKRLIFSTSE